MTVCKRCVMNDDADALITFDADGYCNYCTDALEQKSKVYFPNEDGRMRLEHMIEKLKKEGEGKEYDCLMGLSGGLDSSYLAYLGADKWGLRIVAVHIEDGFETDISKKNIKKLVEKSGMHFINIQPDFEQYNDLVLSFMKAGVPNIAAPQDNILLGFICEFAKKNGIKYFLSGENYALECILQQGNTWSNADIVNIKDIHKRFGTKPIDKLYFKSYAQRTWDTLRTHMIREMPLNYVEYNRDRAFRELNDYCGFEYYGSKHLENHFTAFIQGCWLPEKFGVDKRTSHLSSMIVSDQLTRDDALAELGKPLCDKVYMDEVKAMIVDQFGITSDELERLITAKPHQHFEYKTDFMIRWGKALVGRLKARSVSKG